MMATPHPCGVGNIHGKGDAERENTPTRERFNKDKVRIGATLRTGAGVPNSETARTTVTSTRRRRVNGGVKVAEALARLE